jgi:hypothetical protein
MFDDAGLSKKYWAFDVPVEVCFKNRTPTQSVVGKTPYETWHGRKPCLKLLGVLRSFSFVHVSKEKRKKLDYRATPSIFDGYSVLTKQYFVCDPLARTLHCSRAVVCRD